MAKARRRPVPEEDRDPAPLGSDDPLGKLLEEYRVSLAGVLLMSGVNALIGLGLIAYALTREPYSLPWLLAGTFVLLVVVALLGTNVFNVGRRLELRKHGVRFVEGGVETAFTWDEIADVEVNRTDDTYLGVASVRRRSSNASRPAGPLTKTEWDVTIHAHDGRTIRLRPTFFRIVPVPKKLISHLRLRAGLR